MYLEDAGFMAYEVSNHALNSDARSRHNVNIWRGMDYVGIGPGAHGRLTLDGVRYATYARPDLRAYCDAIFQHCDRGEIYALSVTEAQEERLMLGLRTLEGVDVRQIEGLDIVTRSQALIASEFMELSAWRLSPTPKGLRVLDRILYEILA
jgi:oxygen-independent coproporphyrinogen-3 oxidase